MSAWQIVRDAERLDVVGELAIRDAGAIWRTLHSVSRDPGDVLDIDLSRATAIDGAIIALLVEERAGLLAGNTRCQFVGASTRLAPLVHLYGGDGDPTPRREPHREAPLARLGAATAGVVRGLAAVVAFVGALAGASAAIGRRRVAPNWRALPALVERAGADAIPIVLLLNFLVGFVGAFQSTVQLRQFGANIYVADIVGVSVTRELAPLITAIIISGRSGAAFAAELGTMRVSEEIDALRTMGFAPHPYLVIPRVWALAIAAPALTLLGDVAGVAGGLVVGIASLGIPATGFIAELRTAVIPSDVWTGIVKSVAFGMTIGLIGCQQGLAVRGAASGVGRGTTTTVVYCLFAIVTLDTAFTMLFRGFGL